MHPARPFHTTGAATLVARLRAHPFALILTNGAKEPLATHAPVLIDDAGTQARFHLSRGSALVPLLAAGARARIVATGGQAYISPDWYGVEDQVPTWNYLSVECAGPVRVLDDVETTRLLDDSSAFLEAPLAPKPAWTRHKMGEGVFARMLGGIVAYAMTVETLVGTTKLNQNKPPEARRGVIDALPPGDPIAAAMKATLP